MYEWKERPRQPCQDAATNERSTLLDRLRSAYSQERRQPKDTKQPVGEVEGSYEPHKTQNGLIGMDNLTSYFAPVHPRG